MSVGEIVECQTKKEETKINNPKGELKRTMKYAIVNGMHRLVSGTTIYVRPVSVRVKKKRKDDSNNI